jgi:hypothetical protein
LKKIEESSVRKIGRRSKLRVSGWLGEREFRVDRVIPGEIATAFRAIEDR